MGKNLPANAGDARDAGLIPELGRSPGEGNGNLPRSSPGRTRNTQGMSGVGKEEDRQTDTHTDGCVEEVAFFYF